MFPRLRSVSCSIQEAGASHSWKTRTSFTRFSSEEVEVSRFSVHLFMRERHTHTHRKINTQRDTQREDSISSQEGRQSKLWCRKEMRMDSAWRNKCSSRKQARPSASFTLTSFQAVPSLDSELPSVCTQQEACKLAFLTFSASLGHNLNSSN